ncbi:MAG TPA: alanyl-tRNA editing protein [Nanoarchaeota archaeon]|nr:alanyl-tRNA editing protein [Candidatus Pacearchaeota archaeon]HIH17930.1 alanyl-tRNA editing protein [Nanoarchaeota archaeon]HIH33994.1 alanyl-tRNA editing protein [Nanoarchaeota archaeon]HIH51067.1 alanyl-tRNA editing protein [Nanoarchaeota archaeon]HIH66492.1 alanyl-tRNA editing protein [Nanoarchaeota archaeon]
MDALYLGDPYMNEFEAELVSVDGREVVLDKTAFYPEGGGQPCDTGTISCGGMTFRVVSVRKNGGIIIHELGEENSAGELKLIIGQRIKGKIDWERRCKLMRMHTAAHLLASLFHSRDGALITGNQLNLERSRIDFSLEGFDREKIDARIAEANGLIQKNLPVKFYWLDREEALKTPELFKLAAGFKHAMEKIRIVEIEGIDRQADGGTHVSSLGEIGKIEFLKAENKGKSNRRVYFTVK